MKKKLSLMLIIIITLVNIWTVFADESLINKLENEAKSIIENGSENLETAVDAISELVKYTVDKFSDVKESDWYTQTVSKLVGLGIIDGYEDGTFKPQGNIQADAFIKMTVTALGHELENGESYWSEPYIEKAIDLKLVKEGEFSDYTRPINRAEIARVIVRAMDEGFPKDLDKYIELISDYKDIPDELKEYVLKAYVKGIVTGYPDGTFGYNKNATRAEASTMLIRMLDKSERKAPGKPTNDITKRTTKLTEEDIERLQEYECYKLTYDGKLSANYKSFEEKYKNDRNNAKYVYKNFKPKGFLYSWYKYETDTSGEEYLYTDAEVNWLSSPKLVYDNPVNSSVIRGILQIKYPKDKVVYREYPVRDNDTSTLKANTLYEVDVEFDTRFTTDGNYVPQYKYLSDFKEVK